MWNREDWHTRHLQLSKKQGMASALRVVAGALAAGPAGVVWALRKSQQEGELAPNSTLASLTQRNPRCVATCN